MESRHSKTSHFVLIQPKKGLFNLELKELFRRWFLIKLFVRRDFDAQYKQSVLGPAWRVISPILSTAVFTIVFGGILGVKTDGVPHALFYLGGVVLWSFFASSFQKTASTFIENSQLFSKVYFPRLSVSIAAILTHGITLAIQFALFLIVLAYFFSTGSMVSPNLYVFLFPVLVLQLAFLAFGAGLLVASTTVKYRDIGYLVTFFTQLWMYATPIVYPLSEVPENWRWLMALNPVAPVVEMFRYGFFGAGQTSWTFWGISLLTTLFVCLLGAAAYSRVERTFVDTV